MVDISLILEETYSLKTEDLTYRIAGTLQIIVSTWLLIFFLDFVLCQSVVHTSCQLQVLSDFLDIIGTEFYTPAIHDTTVDIAVGSTENRRNLTTSIHPLTVTTLIVAIYSQVQAAQYGSIHTNIILGSTLCHHIGRSQTTFRPTAGRSCIILSYEVAVATAKGLVPISFCWNIIQIDDTP